MSDNTTTRKVEINMGLNTKSGQKKDICFFVKGIVGRRDLTKSPSVLREKRERINLVYRRVRNAGSNKRREKELLRSPLLSSRCSMPSKINEYA